MARPPQRPPVGRIQSPDAMAKSTTMALLYSGLLSGDGGARALHTGDALSLLPKISELADKIMEEAARANKPSGEKSP